MSDQMDSVYEALRFFRSVIKCGEPWTGRCEEMLTKALDELDAAKPEPEPKPPIEEAPAVGLRREIVQGIASLGTVRRLQLARWMLEPNYEVVPKSKPAEDDRTEALEACVNVLRWLDRRGRLGLDEHETIRDALARLDAAKPEPADDACTHDDIDSFGRAGKKP